MMLQGMKKYKVVYLNTISGIVVNTLHDIPIILLLNKIGITPYLGSLISTIVGQSVAFSIVLISLKKEYNFKYKEILKVLLNTLLSVLVMFIPMCIFKILLFKNSSYLLTLVELGLSGIISVLLYVFITYKTGFLDTILGENFLDKILVKLRLKKAR